MEEALELKNNMPKFMINCGFPIKGIVCSGEETPKSLSETNEVSIARYKWDTLTDKMKVTVPKISMGTKTKEGLLKIQSSSKMTTH